MMKERTMSLSLKQFKQVLLTSVSGSVLLACAFNQVKSA